jgi:tripartite-type tricarboxylate transporter receptor subunit TctC
MVRILQLPQTQERLAELGYDIIAETPENSVRYIKEEIAKWAKVVRGANLKAQAS